MHPESDLARIIHHTAILDEISTEIALYADDPADAPLLASALASAEYNARNLARLALRSRVSLGADRN